MACERSIEPPGWTCGSCGFSPETREGVLCFSAALADGGAGFDVADFPRLAALEGGNFWHRARRRLIQWALEHYFPQAQKFLEVGCGTGFVLTGLRDAFPALEIAGSEVFVEGLKYASQRLPGIPLWQMDARRMPFRDEFDVIGAFDVLEHIQEDEVVLAELRRAVRAPQGGIILTVPQHPWLWSARDEAAHHERRYVAADLIAKVERAGFDILRVTSFVTTLLPPMMLSRLGPRSRDSSDEGEAVHPIVNRVFEMALNAELACIRRGLSLPVGGSLLVVARVSRGDA